MTNLVEYTQGRVELLPTDNAAVLAILPVLSSARDDLAGQVLQRAVERMKKK